MAPFTTFDCCVYEVFRPGDEVIEHYANYARVELAAYDAAVTDWELRRCFERL